MNTLSTISSDLLESYRTLKDKADRRFKFVVLGINRSDSYFLGSRSKTDDEPDLAEWCGWLPRAGTKNRLGPLAD